MSDNIIRKATGSVRNKIGSKNFGFATVDGQDVFVHLEHLHATGFTKPEFTPGAEIVLDYEEQPDGRFRAVAIHKLGGRDASPQKSKTQVRRTPKPKTRRISLNVGDVIIGRFADGCQWDRKFGFVRVTARYEGDELRRFSEGERPKDLFVHVSCCPEEYDEAVAAGGLLELRVIEGRQPGQFAGEVMQLHEGELVDEELAEETSEAEVAEAA